MLEKIKAELENSQFNIVYSDDEIVVLSQLKAIETPEYGVFSSNKMRAFLSKENLYIGLKQLADRTHDIYSNDDYAEFYDTIHNAASATVDTINTGEAFDYSDEYVRAGVGLFGDINFFNDEQLAECLALGANIVKPFEASTLRLVKQALGTSPNSIDIAWNNERYLKITLASDLFEPVSPSLSVTNHVFDNEPVGRTKRMQTAGSYIVDLSGVQKTGTLHVFFGIDADVSLELVN